jgi:hypothetical protein
MVSQMELTSTIPWDRGPPERFRGALLVLTCGTIVQEGCRLSPLTAPQARIYHLPGGHRLGQTDHTPLNLLRPLVRLTGAEPHRDISHIAQLHACGSHPTRTTVNAARGVGRTTAPLWALVAESASVP